MFRVDETVTTASPFSNMRGAQTVAKAFSGRARGLQPVLVNGTAGAMWAPNGQPLDVFRFMISNGKITNIQVIGDPAQINQLDLY